jgi:hypothetical protein
MMGTIATELAGQAQDMGLYDLGAVDEPGTEL